MKKIVFLYLFISSIVYADELPSALKKYQESGLLDGSWICRQDATVFVNKSWASAARTEKRIVINEIRAKCPENPDQITFQMKSPFKNLGRWIKNPESYEDF